MDTATTQQTLAFATMCVDLTAKAEGRTRKEMYRPLHTQSKEYVVSELLNALKRLEAERKENTPKTDTSL